MTRSGGHRFGPRLGGRDGRRRLSGAFLAVVAAVLGWPMTAGTAAYAATGYAAAMPAHTRSYYEASANPAVLYRQGVAAGKVAAQGIVILDFGRPAYKAAEYGTVGYRGKFMTLAAITRAVQRYITGYFRYAPRYTTLDVAVGTNNSCGTGQPCGSAICGCTYEPPSFFAWGGQLARTVESLAAWATQTKLDNRFTDTVRVVAADDAEPAYDPGYYNTYDLLQGYAEAVGGTSPPMVDYGSADKNYWTDAQLFQVAYGFRPDVPMPQVYYPSEAKEWAALLRYGTARRRSPMLIFGVLTEGRGTNDPATAYSDMLGAITGVNHQQSIPWVSTIAG